LIIAKSEEFAFLGALRLSAVKRFSMSGFNLQELMSQAKQQYETLQKKMEQTVVEASSGGGTVTVKMDGRKQVLAITIDPEAVKAGDVEMLQDLVMAAMNEAARKVDQAMQSSVGGMLGGLGLGGL
jgi:DNA-binding YbaB/EbfC family protein